MQMLYLQFHRKYINEACVLCLLQRLFNLDARSDYEIRKPLIYAFTNGKRAFEEAYVLCSSLSERGK